jgi:hypothetical protein
LLISRFDIISASFKSMVLEEVLLEDTLPADDFDSFVALTETEQMHTIIAAESVVAIIFLRFFCIIKRRSPVL